ncbi:transcriptional regulator of acetoin/glycerol metabolism [Kineosphaera limosa]|uniref:GAF domain-containing protein n=1 Tax=Kineosphaera limosa NBRC 100340 TaxID=1184609 RepID=K6X7V4_9MICO|nr:GAF domain-containing protein [Kineosphaera limosa]NYE00936.1 transcriptional regulator of acetoin/glycerol metabolism [Kineosphaera limosa]GAB94869.1 hypothetical protein KILIM_014_00040 [Kineosphaera limosa NBRC 100340]
MSDKEDDTSDNTANNTADGIAAPRADRAPDVVRASWDRSLARLRVPDQAVAEVVFDGADLAGYREAHPLAAAMPVVRRLLVQPCTDSGIIVAVGDARGRLLWVEGDAGALRSAESMVFAPGADWSEAVVGTSAPGTALILGSGVQITGSQHFSPLVRGWHCTAAPIRDPDTGDVLGVVDLTGGAEAVGPHALALVGAAIAAAQAELALQRLRGLAPAAVPDTAQLRVLGRDTGLLIDGGRTIALSLRHTEILVMLARHPDGLRLEELAALVNPEASVTTLRAEMVRLRRRLEAEAPAWVPQSRPYRLAAPLASDADQVLEHTGRGWHRAALEAYAGQVLPPSEAPGVRRLRAEVSGALRDTVVGAGSVEAMLAYLALPEAQTDADAWLTTLRRLPPRSPRRDRIVRHLEWLESELR